MKWSSVFLFAAIAAATVLPDALKPNADCIKIHKRCSSTRDCCGGLLCYGMSSAAPICRPPVKRDVASGLEARQQGCVGMGGECGEGKGECCRYARCRRQGGEETWTCHPIRK